MGGYSALRSSILFSFRRREDLVWMHAIVLLIVLVLASASPNDAPVSNVGRTFTFLVPGADINRDNKGPIIFVTAPLSLDDERAIRVRAEVRAAEFDKSIYVRRGSTGVIRLPATATGVSTGPQRGTVRMGASAPVTVQVMATGGPSSEAFLALPLESLGLEYLASSTSPANDFDSQSSLTITGTCDSTSVSVKSSGLFMYIGVDYKTGRTLRIKLDNGESIQIQSDDAMTGTRITSDKPISVLAATTCPADREDCQFIVEQLSPVYALGRQFLLAHPDAAGVESRVGQAFVLATRSGTTVEISSLGLRHRMGRGDEWQLPVERTDWPLFLVADRPVQVTLFSPSCSPRQQSCSGRANTMTVIPPMEQFHDRADFTVWNASDVLPAAGHFQNFLTILAAAACEKAASAVALTTSDQSEDITWTTEGVSGKPDACVMRARVVSGTFHLSGAQSGAPGVHVRFAALLYAEGSHHLTYSMPVTFGGNHLGYISRESQRHECYAESFDPCEVNPCRNSGDCIRDGDGYRCSCISPFYGGPLCETEVDPCSLEETFCFNGGTCSSHRSPLCSCTENWGGKLCEYEISQKPGSTHSRDFVFTFMEHPIPRRSPSIVVTTSADSVNTTLVKVHVPAVGFTKTLRIPPNRAQVVELPVEAISLGSRQQPSGVSLSASQDVTVTAFHNSIAQGDGFLAIPVEALGTLHRVVAARQRKKRSREKSQFAIVAADGNTTVFIRTHVSVTFHGRAYAAYSYIIAHLQRLEVVQIQSKFDLTQTEVSSDKPVAVLSGSTCGYAMYEGTDRKSCCFMVEQMLPKRSWGKRFVVAPFLGNTYGETTVRIIGGAKETTVRDGYVNKGFLYDGSTYEMYITRPVYITATRPVMVVAFSVQATSQCPRRRKARACQVVSVPTMSIVPTLNQITTSAMLVTPSTTNTYSLRYKNYINVVTTNCTDIGLSSLSPSSKGEPDWDKPTAYLHNAGMCVISMEVPPGKYRVSSTSGNVAFTAQQYGFNNHGTAYGFPITPSHGDSATDGTKSTLNSLGKEFFLTFISGGNYSPQKGPRLLITAATDAQRTEVDVAGADLKVSLTLQPNEVRVVDVPPTLVAIDGHTPYPDIAIHVRSSHDVVVYGMNDAFGSDDEGYKTVSDGYLALPLPALGREYKLVTSWPQNEQHPESYTQFVIIGAHDATRVDIVLNEAVWFDNYIYYGGSSLTIALNRGQVAYFKSYNDQTGTHVMSSKPVAVISGTDCGFAHQYPNSGPARFPCDHQVEFLLPVTRWGSVFLLAPLQGYRGGDIYVRIQAIHDFTTVRLGSGAEHNFQEFDSPFSFTVGEQGMTDRTLAESNRPVSVSAFSVYQPLLMSCLGENGTCEGYSKPVLFTVPSVESFKRRVMFPSYRIRGADDMACYADIYTKCLEAESVLVNGEERSWPLPLEEIPETGYCVLRLQLASEETVASYVVESSLENGRLGVIAYGFSTRSGYAFPGGM